LKPVGLYIATFICVKRLWFDVYCRRSAPYKWLCMYVCVCKYWTRWQLACFYRAKLCVSAVLAVVWCPSVRSSVTLVNCIQTAKDIVKLLSRPGSPVILVSWGSPVLPTSEGNPLSEGVKYMWMGNAIYNWNRRLSRKLYDIGPWLLWNLNRKS